MLTIMAIDKNSSDIMSRTFETNNLKTFKENVSMWESEIPFRRYFLEVDDIVEGKELEEVLDELEITF